MSIVTDLARTAPILASAPQPHTERRNVIRQATDTLSRRGIAAAKAELANTALEALLGLVYQADTDNALCNLDAGGRILVPTPMGRLGCRHWQLRPSEARVLGRILTARAGWVLTYDSECRAWCVNLRKFPTLGRAMAALASEPVTAQEWRDTAQAMTTAWAKGSGKVSAG
jgi:hypothetical protein